MSNPKRVRIALVCEECSARNYHTKKARKAGEQQRLAFKKFCPTCKQHTLHRESK